MNEGWQTRPLGDLCEFQRGLTYSKGDEVDLSDNVVLRAMNIDLATHLLDFTELKYISDRVAVPENKKVKKGSLMICTASGSRSHLGKVAFIDDDYGYAFGGFMGMLTPNGELVPRYLFHLMTSVAYEEFIRALAAGMNINNLKFDDLRQFQVPYPPRPEQHRIVRILDEAFAAIAIARANTEQNLSNARELLESHLRSVFTSRDDGSLDKRLSDLCDEITVGHVGSMASRYKDSGIPFLRSQNVRPFEVSLDNVVFINEDFHHSLAKSRLRPGDLAIVRTGYPGTAAVVPPELPDSNCADLVIVRPGSQVDPHYLAAFFNSALGKELVAGRLVGAAQRHFNVTSAKAVRLHVPVMSEQQRVVALIHSLRAETQRLASVCERKLAALEDLKQSLLHQAFAGTL